MWFTCVSYEGCCFLDEAYLFQISQLMVQANCLARVVISLLKLALVKGCLLQAVNPWPSRYKKILWPSLQPFIQKVLESCECELAQHRLKCEQKMKKLTGLKVDQHNSQSHNLSLASQIPQKMSLRCVIKSFFVKFWFTALAFFWQEIITFVDTKHRVINIIVM